MARQLAFNDDVVGGAGNSSIYVQIATPKSPNSDGFSPSHEPEVSPLEEEIRQRLLEEVDLEVLLKHREFHLVQNEIHRVLEQMETLEKVHDDKNYTAYIKSMIALKKEALEAEKLQAIAPKQPEPVYNLRRTSKEHEPAVHRTSYGGLRPVMDAQGNKICVHKRSDGVIVRVDCPRCGRTDFGSAQGFLNHARLAHAIEYKSQDDAALCCGTVLPDSEQDAIGSSSVVKLKEAGLDIHRNLAPGVCIDEMVKKKRRASKSEGYLEKLFAQKGGDGFKELVDDITTKEEIGEDDTTASPPEEPQSTHQKKRHNRRKSRGGLSAVSFEDKAEVWKEVSPTTVEKDVTFIAGEFIEDSEDMTPAQRRRVPTVSEPLRTRSRTSRENSN